MGDALTTSYDSLMVVLGALNNPGEQQVDVNLGIQIGTLKAGLLLGFGANVQDDRRQRITGSIGLELTNEFDLYFWQTKIGVSLVQKGSWVFESLGHLCSWLLTQIKSYVDAVKKYFSEKTKADAKAEKRDLTPEEKAEMLRSRRKKTQITKEGAKDPTRVSTTSVKAFAENKIGGIQIDGSHSRSRSTFTRANRKTGRKETTESSQHETAITVKHGSLSASVTYTGIEGDANPDNNGDYLNLSIEGDISPEAVESKPFKKAMEELSSWVPDPDQKIQVFAKKILGKLEGVLKQIGTSKKSVAKDQKTYGVEFNWVDKSGFKLQ